MASLVLGEFARNALCANTGLNGLLSNCTMQTRTGAAAGPANAAGGTLLVTHTLPPAANNTAANGVVTLDTIASANGEANGDAGHVRILSGADVVAEGDCGTSGNTVVFDNISIATNQVVSISSANFTVPAGT